jgi:hypothetical protein
MSGYTANAFVRHGVVNSDIALLEKPFTPESLGKAVRQALDATPRSTAFNSPRPTSDSV